MIFVHYNAAELALHYYVEEYNHQQTSVASQIRQPMVATAWRLIKIYGAFLIKANGISPIDPQNPPPLATNNAQLTYMSQYCKRTVQRHLKRLIQAGIITKKVWHGSKASYELWINPKVLGIKVDNNVDEAQQAQKAVKSILGKKGLESPKNSDFKEGATKSLHTETRNYTNNIVIGVDNSDSPIELEEDQRCSLPLTVENGASSDAGNREIRSSLSLTVDNGASSVPGNLTGYPGEELHKPFDDPGEEAQETRPNVSARLGTGPDDPDRLRSLSFYVDQLWAVACNNLYREKFLSDRIVTRAKEQIRRWYEPVSSGALSRIHSQYVERIGLVRKYIAKDPQNRFVQLPDRYFDPYNSSGLAGTKAWYDQYRARKEEVRAQLITHRQIRRFLNNRKKDLDQRKPELDLFRECQTRIGKLQRPELMEQFYAAVISPNSFNQLNRVIHEQQQKTPATQSR